MNTRRRIRSVVALLATITLAACGGTGAGRAGVGGARAGSGSDTGTSATAAVTTAGGTVGSEGDSSWLPFTGTLTLDEIGWFVGPDFYGVIQVSLPTGTKQRVFDGSQPRWHASGRTTYRQSCGDNVFRIVSGAPGTRPQSLTPCSSEIDNPGYSNSVFWYSALSPDSRLLAVDHAFYFDGGTVQNTLLFDTANQAVLTEFENHVDGMWMPDGSLLMAGLYGGLSVGDPLTGRMTAFADGRFTGTIRNPTLSPDGSQIAFELDQQIWVANVDGSNPRAVIFGDRRFRFPAWSPDGGTLAYLGVDGGVGEDRFDQAIYFTHLETGQQYTLDMTPWLTAVHATVMGPMTWH